MGIDDVLEALQAAVRQAIAERSRLGYFAAMYRKVTLRVKEGIEQGFFDDGERMERLDVTFAGRYLSALADHRAGRRPTRCWELAFEAASDARPLIVQHLLLGINAHINLDLGIAAAHTSPGSALPGLRRDFDRVNEILGQMTRRVLDEIDSVSPLIGWLDWMGGRHDEEVIRFSIEVARAEAWRFAAELAPLPAGAWAGPIGARDARVTHLGRRVRDPGFPLQAGLYLIRAAESNDVRHVVEVLNAVEPPSLQRVEARLDEERAPGG